MVFDAADIEAESAFWAAILGGNVTRDDDWHSIKVSGINELSVQWAPDHVPPRWPEGNPPQQIHLDLFVEDIDAAHEEVIGLGLGCCSETRKVKTSTSMRTPPGIPSVSAGRWDASSVG